jgi:hypothetical protein
VLQNFRGGTKYLIGALFMLNVFYYVGMILLYSMVFLFDKKNDQFYNMGKNTFELAEVIVWLSMSLALVSYGFLHYRLDTLLLYLSIVLLLSLTSSYLG